MPKLRANLVVSNVLVLGNSARRTVIAVEKVNAVGSINVPQTSVQNVNHIPTVVPSCIAVNIGLPSTTMSADEAASERHAIAIQTVPCLLIIIASLVKLVGLPGFTVNPTKTVKVMANAANQAYVLLPTARHAIPILTVAGHNTAVNAAVCPTFVAQVVSKSIVYLIMIVESTVSTAVNEATWPTFVVQAV